MVRLREYWFFKDYIGHRITIAYCLTDSHKPFFLYISEAKKELYQIKKYKKSFYMLIDLLNDMEADYVSKWELIDHRTVDVDFLNENFLIDYLKKMWKIEEEMMENE